MNNITLKNKTSSTIKTDIYELDVDGQKVTYIEFINDKNKLIDFNLRDEKGDEIAADTGSTLLEKVQGYVDNLPAIR